MPYQLRLPQNSANLFLTVLASLQTPGSGPECPSSRLSLWGSSSSNDGNEVWAAWPQWFTDGEGGRPCLKPQKAWKVKSQGCNVVVSGKKGLGSHIISAPLPTPPVLNPPMTLRDFLLAQAGEGSFGRYFGLKAQDQDIQQAAASTPLCCGHQRSWRRFLKITTSSVDVCRKHMAHCTLASQRFTLYAGYHWPLWEADSMQGFEATSKIVENRRSSKILAQQSFQIRILIGRRVMVNHGSWPLKPCYCTNKCR